MKATKVWLKVSSDKYELPLAIADTAPELAKLCGVTVNTIYSQMSRVKAGILASCPYICVSILRLRRYGYDYVSVFYEHLRPV